MSENLARCRRCHDVFDPDLGACPRCGTPYQPIAAPPDPSEGTFADRYAASEFADPRFDAPEVVPHANERSVLAIVAGGGLLLAVALIAVFAVLLGGIGSAATPPTIVSLAPATSPPPSPTTPPQIAMALRAINDPNMNAHIVIQNRVAIDSVLNAKPVSNAMTLDCQVSNGDELIMLTSGATKEEIRYVDQTYFLRVLPSTKWMNKSEMTAWAIVLPLFNLNSDRMLEFVGNEQRDGVATYHFKATNRWGPDVARMALMDPKGLPIQPDRIKFDLWTDSFGKPIYAEFTAQNLANDGRKIVDIQTTYTFTDVGLPVDIPNPLATPTPVPSPSPTPAS